MPFSILQLCGFALSYVGLIICAMQASDERALDNVQDNNHWKT